MVVSCLLAQQHLKSYCDRGNADDHFSAAGPSSAYATARANAAAAEAATVAAAATSSTAATPTMFKLPQHSGTSTSAPLHLPPPASSSSKPATTSPLAFSAHKAEPGTESAMQVSGSALRESAATAENSVKVEVAPLPVAMAVDT